MRMGEFDRSGRRRPLPIEGDDFTLPVDVVIAAIGQTVDPDSIPAGVEKGRAGTVVADSKTGVTAMDGVFAGGDCVAGPDTVIGAIAAGKQAAAAIDRYLGGDGVVVPALAIQRQRTAPVIEEETARQVAASLEPAERLQGFMEVELGYDEEKAIAEASRCLRCDVRE
jgi:NADH-quinone oxidoreductase subunit F